MRMMPRAAPSAMRRWGVQRRWLILHDSGAQRTVQNNVNMKSGWLMKDLCTCFLLLNSFLLSSCSTVGCQPTQVSQKP